MSMEVLYEMVMNTIPPKIQKELSKKSVRATMPSDAFLLPSEKKFPIKRPGDDKIDVRLVYAAYVRAKQWSEKKPQYEKVAGEAKQIFLQNNGPNILKIKLEGVDLSDTEMRQINQLMGKRPDITPKDQSNDPEICICPECDYEGRIGIDDTICEKKKCPKCGAQMISSIFSKSTQKELDDEEKAKVKDKSVSESLKSLPTMQEKMRFLMEHKSKTHQRVCDNCNIIVTEQVSDDNPVCPNCGQNFKEITESISGLENTKHFSCPKCKTIKPYTRINEDICPICESLMVVFAAPNIKKDKGIPTTD